MNPRLSIAVGSVAAGATSFYGYEDWKQRELKRMSLLALELSQEGFLKLRSDTGTVPKKKIAWDMLLKPRMMKHWRSVHAEFDPTLGSYPEPPNGKNYAMTLRESAVPGMPRVYSSNYLAQAVLCYFVDPDMQLIHFGEQTHWKLKLLIDPMWALTSLLSPTESMIVKPKEMYTFEGDDQAWHITTLPNKHGEAGKAVPWNSHFDAGPGNLFHRGLPPSMPTVRSPISSSPSLSHRERAMLSVAVHQLAILFYCETPGALTADRGATGFYPKSHLVVHEGLSKLLEGADRGDGSGRPALLWGAVGFALREVFRSPYALASDAKRSSSGHGKIQTSKVLPGELVQPELGEDETLLALGTCVHTGMFATQWMPENNPRVIQNLKVRANRGMLAPYGGELVELKRECATEAARAATLEAFLCRVNKESLLFRTFTRPLAAGQARPGEPYNEIERLRDLFVKVYERAHD